MSIKSFLLVLLAIQIIVEWINDIRHNEKNITTNTQDKKPSINPLYIVPKRLLTLGSNILI